MTGPRTTATLVLVALVALATAPRSAAAAGSSPASPSALGIRLTEIPASEHDDPRARLYVIDRLAPGARITRRIEVSNTGDAVLAVHLYAAAAAIHGGTFLGAPGRTQGGVSSWTSVTPAELAVPGHAAIGASVTIVVPSDADPGEQYAVIWAEAGPGRATAPGGVTVVNRVGIRVYLSVGPGGSPGAAFSIDSMTAERDAEGHPVVLATVHNGGGRALDMSGTLHLGEGPAGLSAGPFAAQLGTTLAPGDTEPVTFRLDQRMPAGPWDAVMTLRSGQVEETASATITFPTAGASPPADTTGQAVTPRRFLWVVALLLLIGFAIVWERRRRHRGVPA